jgi:hypothetical protein
MNIKLLNQKGQAIFEMIIFLPFLIFLYTIFYTVGNSISGSINQQKAVRGYFYQLVKGNSYVLSTIDLDSLNGKSIDSAGFFAIGWAEKKDGGADGTPFGNCFKFGSLLRNGSSETCEDPSTSDQPGLKSSFVRIFTMYGVCGPVFTRPANAQTINQKPYELDQAAQMGECALK